MNSQDFDDEWERERLFIKSLTELMRRVDALERRLDEHETLRTFCPHTEV